MLTGLECELYDTASSLKCSYCSESLVGVISSQVAWTLYLRGM